MVGSEGLLDDRPEVAGELIFLEMVELTGVHLGGLRSCRRVGLLVL